MERNNYGAEPDLSHAQLRNANLKGYELINANQRQAPQTAHVLAELMKGGRPYGSTANPYDNPNG
jgi:hypothetical protein